MRRPDIGGRRFGQFRLALGLALHQHDNPARQHVNLAPLPGDDLGQVVIGPDQMAEPFFKRVDPVHGICASKWGPPQPKANGRRTEGPAPPLAAPPPIR